MLGVNLTSPLCCRLIAALDNAAEACELSLRMHSGVKAGHSMHHTSPASLGVNLILLLNCRLIAALDNAAEACELSLRMHSRSSAGNALQQAGITVLLQKLLTAALQHRLEVGSHDDSISDLQP